jgi:microcystin-dependent protein
MGTPFMGELKLISWNFPPKGWAFCNGQFLPINQNQALFSLLGTMYGGNGQTTFALPDLRGRAPLHIGQGFIQGQTFGQEFHTLTLGEMPQHNHFVNVSTQNGNQADISIMAGLSNAYSSGFTDPTTLQPATVTNVGGSQPHENRQPLLVLNWIIALQGVFPSRN